MLRLHSILLQNFRNYKKEEIVLSPYLNLLIGDNGQGKSNLLEAIFFLSSGTSFRTIKDAEMINERSQNFFLRGVVFDGGRKHTLETGFALEIGRKLFKINGGISRAAEAASFLPVVLFVPEDLSLVKGGPAARRKFLDMEIGRFYKYYNSALHRYRRTLQQRNYLLKQRNFSPHHLSTWNRQMVDSGSIILQGRRTFLERLHPLAFQVHRVLTGGRENLSIEYLSSIGFLEAGGEAEMKEVFLSYLEKNVSQDRLMGFTRGGPHRDDLVISINGQDARRFASQGQQRTAVLSLKIAQLKLLKEKLGFYPLLLLDDVLSELDAPRRRYLISFFKEELQTLITATRKEDLEKELLEKGTLFKVKEGRVALWNL